MGRKRVCRSFQNCVGRENGWRTLETKQETNNNPMGTDCEEGEDGVASSFDPSIMYETPIDRWEQTRGWHSTDERVSQEMLSTVSSRRGTIGTCTFSFMLFIFKLKRYECVSLRYISDVVNSIPAWYGGRT